MKDDIIQAHDDAARYMSLRELTDWLRDRAGEYEAALAKLADPVYLRARLEKVARHRLYLEAFAAADHPSKAVFLLSRADVLIRQEVDDLVFVRRYEARREQLEAMHRTTDGGARSA